MATRLVRRQVLAASIAFLAGLVQTATHAGEALTAGETDTSQSDGNLTEVIVTAQKFEERLLDVPVPVTVLSAASLVETNRLRLQDYFSSVPGLTLQGGSGGDNTIAIRGITTGGATVNATVAVLLDDVPISTSAGAASGLQNFVPDLDPSDLQHVEVLKGPQGTLYGASSLGGLIKYVTADPSTAGFSGHIEADGSSTYNGDGPGYGARASVNVPLSDSVALRASGFARRDAGYIDDPYLDLKGVNEENSAGGRLSLLWRPSADLSIKLGALLQGRTADGFNISMPELGDLKQAYLRGTGRWYSHVQVYTLDVNAKLGGIDVAAISGYTTHSGYGIGDFGGGLALPTSSQFAKFSQELRLSSSIAQHVDWLFGLFYTHERSPVQQQLLFLDPGTGEVTGSLGQLSFPSTYTEYAAFAALTVHFTDRFDVQFGGRESHNEQEFNETDTGQLTEILHNAPSPYYWPTYRSSGNAFTYLVTPRLKLSPDVMLYARLASGYRPGGPNTAPTFVPNAPLEFGADTTKNYELGLKAAVLDRKLTLDASVYYIDWSNIQLTVQTPGPESLLYVTNGGNAKSEGVELSAQATPVGGMTLAGWVAYNEAVLTQDLPAAAVAAGAYGLAGDPLPLACRWSGSLSIEQRFRMGQDTTLYGRASANYVGDREGGFTSISNGVVQPRAVLPSYVQADALVGIQHRAWTLRAFVTNIADKRGELTSAGPSNSSVLPQGSAVAVTYIQPRTVGASLDYTF